MFLSGIFPYVTSIINRGYKSTPYVPNVLNYDSQSMDTYQTYTKAKTHAYYNKPIPIPTHKHMYSVEKQHFQQIIPICRTNTEDLANYCFSQWKNLLVFHKLSSGGKKTRILLFVCSDFRYS